MNLPGAIAAMLSGATVRGALLVRFDFASGIDRVWEGVGPLQAAGHTWKGMGGFGSIDGLSNRSDTAAVAISFRLSGVDPELIRIARNASNEVTGRPCYVYLQFFDADWVTLDQPIPLRSAIMDQMTYEVIGPTQAGITLTAEGVFAARNAVPFAFYTDRDQNARFPGDRGLEVVPSLIHHIVEWPVA